jgi:hypothetical protein
LGRRPARPDVSLDDNPIVFAIKQVARSRTAFHEMSPQVIQAVIDALLGRIPSKKRHAVARHLKRLQQDYRIIQVTHREEELAEEKLAQWATGVISGKGDDADRCDGKTLLIHRQLALAELKGLSRPRPAEAASADSARDLQERVARLLKAMAAVPCLCERDHPAHTTVPTTDTLKDWPTSLGALADRLVAWYHRQRPETMRRRLIKARAESRVEQGRSRKIREVADELLRSKDIATRLMTIRRAQAQGVLSADQAAELEKHFK